MSRKHKGIGNFRYRGAAMGRISAEFEDTMPQYMEKCKIIPSGLHACQMQNPGFGCYKHFCLDAHLWRL